MTDVFVALAFVGGITYFGVMVGTAVGFVLNKIADWRDKRKET
jgi:hypothetical protein